MKQALGTVMFGCFLAIYLTAFVTVGIGMTAKTFYHTDLGESALFGGCLLVVLIGQLGWGIVAGIIDNRRGWRAVGRCHTTLNAFSLILLNLAFAVPTMIIAWTQRAKHGKFLPAPNEC
jgi:MFS family permease